MDQISNYAVRDCLARDHGIVIPSGTVFVGGRHNTTADEIEYVDVGRIPESVGAGGIHCVAAVATFTKPLSAAPNAFRCRSSHA